MVNQKDGVPRDLMPCLPPTLPPPPPLRIRLSMPPHFGFGNWLQLLITDNVSSC